jgi:hypothetical protein
MRDVLFCILQFGICLAVNLLYNERENGASKSIVRDGTHNFFVYGHSNNFYKGVVARLDLNFFLGKDVNHENRISHCWHTFCFSDHIFGLRNLAPGRILEEDVM